MRPLSETKWVQCETAAGSLVFVARPELRDRHKSIVLLIHDVMGSPGDLAPWFGRLEPEADVLLAVLPGHANGPPLATAGWDALVEAYDRSLQLIAEGRRVLAAGAGLGGVLALALNARGHASMSFDPYLSSAKQWPLEVGLGRATERGTQPHADILFDALGWRDGAVVEDRAFTGLLDRLKASAAIVCGDIPLEPQRDLETAPSLLDAADHALLAAYPDVQVHVLEGCGHNVLGQAPDVCRDLILDQLARA